MQLIKYIILLPIEFIRSFIEIFTDRKLFKYSLVPFILGFISFVLISILGLLNLKFLTNLIFNEISSWYEYSYYSVSFLFIIVASTIFAFLVVLIATEFYLVKINSHLFSKYQLKDEISSDNYKISLFRLIFTNLKRFLFFIISLALLLVLSFFPPLIVLWFLLNSFLVGIELFNLALDELNYNYEKKIGFIKSNKFIILVSGAILFLSLFIPMLNLIAIQVRLIYSSRVLKKYILCTT